MFIFRTLFCITLTCVTPSIDVAQMRINQRMGGITVENAENIFMCFSDAGCDGCAWC